MNFLADHTIEHTFGKVPAPSPVAALGFGEVGISHFISSLISLIFIVAGIVFIFMLLWGAVAWLISGGEKEKLASAQQRILHAIIGFVLLGVSFAIIEVIGTFTGFKLFESRGGFETGYDPESNCDTNTYTCDVKKGLECVGGRGEDGHGCRKIR